MFNAFIRFKTNKYAFADIIRSTSLKFYIIISDFKKITFKLEYIFSKCKPSVLRKNKTKKNTMIRILRTDDVLKTGRKQ